MIRLRQGFGETDGVDTRVTRRRFGVTAGCALASAAFGEACLVATNAAPAGDGRLTARPKSDVVNTDAFASVRP